ncbi:MULTISPECIES: hypothetical protein [Bacillus cereus group]|uniref:hypothetical protein n=1 Tax=Bacillus cereus group TaxID=86661 RepID=UPI0018CC9AE5|nr:MULTISPECIES: hypothetical protein [Bacillus cereus group]MBG9839818.1 hypothetical protein [Bacillus tropicus]MBG9879385.1 hypothetical protein [Bacillus tropicus]MBG9922858.1 hypothetical protein [Bacillus tropicus]MBJ8356055.1 hypothetical protein [Bacillus mycoides]MED2903023.1 hypothetical protein [Bacillus tropicus]
MADASYLSETDKLFQGIPKINQAIDNANMAQKNATEAKQIINDNVQKIDKAITNSDEAKQMTLENKGLNTNYGSIYPLKNVVRAGTIGTVTQRVKDTFLNIKIHGAKKNKYYVITFLANGYVSNGSTRHTISFAEYDKETFSTNPQGKILLNYNEYTVPTPTEDIVTHIAEIASDNMIISMTYDKTKIGKEFINLTSATSGEAKTCIIDESCYIYAGETKSIVEPTIDYPLVCKKSGRSIKVKFKYSQDQQMVLDFDKLGINEITHLKRIYKKVVSPNVIDTNFLEDSLWVDITTDWISPYMMAVKNNIVNDSGPSAAGGNHGTDSGSGFPTARHVKTTVYCDGKIVNDGEVVFATEKVVIVAEHMVFSKNAIDLTTGANRDTMKEIVTYTITPRHMKVSTFIQALEDVDITWYFGIQSTRDGWNNEIYFMEELDPTLQVIYKMTDNLRHDSGKKTNSKVNRAVMIKGSDVLSPYYENAYGIGYSHIGDNDTIMYLREGSSGKFYAHLVKNGQTLSLKQGESSYYAGGYIFGSTYPTQIAKAAYSYFESRERIYVLDFFNAGTEYFMPEIDDLNKKVSVINKTDSITIDGYAMGNGIKITSTGYGQVFFKLV